MKKWMPAVIAILLLLVGFSTYGAAQEQELELIDFSTPDFAETFKVLPYITVKPVRNFSTASDYSLQIQSPAWTPRGKEQTDRWPALEFRPAVRDWSGYEWLTFDVVNASETAQDVMMYIADERPFRQGVYLRERIAAKGFRRICVPIADAFAGKKIDPKKISLLHIFTENPPSDMTLYLSNVRLCNDTLREQPFPNARFREEYAALAGERMQTLARKSKDTARKIRSLSDSFGSGPWVSFWQKRLEYADSSARFFDRFYPATCAVIDEAERRSVNLDCELASCKNQLEWAMDAMKICSDMPAFLIGSVPATDSVLPFAPQITAVAAQIKLELAANEYESTQIVLMPLANSLNDVSISFSEFATSQNDRLPESVLTAAPIGYVKTATMPIYGTNYIGYYPNFVMSYLTSTNIDVDVAQSFLIRVHAPKGQQSGVYRGRIFIKSAQELLQELPVSIRIFDFELPDAAPLDMAITFWGDDNPADGERRVREQRIKDPSYPVNIWKEKKREWAQFLSRYYITYDSLYMHQGWSPDFELLLELKKAGRLGRFNLGYFPYASASPEFRSGLEKTIEKIRPAYEKAKEYGLLEHAYLYGCDEVRTPLHARVEQAAQIMKQEFPGCELITTAQSGNYGENPAVPSIDVWVTIMDRYDLPAVERTRKSGRKVWWYTGCFVKSPYPNVFLEYPPSDTRMMMGMLNAKYRPDGFLYYQISLWNSAAVLGNKTMTDWNPRSFGNTHGDGCLTGVGPGGIPVSTLRLENFRDGLEDYSYILLLEKKIGEWATQSTLSPRQKTLLAHASQLIRIPVNVARSTDYFTSDFHILNSYRNELAETLEQMK